MMFFGGLAIYITRSENIMYLPGAYVAIGKDGFLAIGRGGNPLLPYSFFIALAIAAVAHITLNRTVLGRWFYAVGRNAKAAVISGVPADRVVILAYVFSGFCAAVASILYSARLEHGRPTIGPDILLDIIGAAVIGGISLFGGKGKVLWALFGVLFFTLLANSLTMMNLSFYSVYIVKGSVIVLAAFLDVTRIRILARTGTA
jgi:ribose/xylose/arabinose/galactoside ABC-type transport system permease subunit